MKRKLNYRNNTKEDIEINKDRKVLILSDAPFQYKRIHENESKLINIKTVLEETKRFDRVSLVAFINIQNGLLVPTKLRRSPVVMNKKEVQANDSSGVIKIALWGKHIDAVLENGVYKIEGATVNEWNGVISLNTNQYTKVTPSSEKIDAKKVNIMELVTSTFQFPPVSIISVACQYACPQCGKSAEADETKVFKCPACSSMVLVKNLKRRYIIKLSFTNKENLSKVVTMYHRQITDYFSLKGEPIPTTSDDLVEHLLTDESTEIVLDYRGTVIAGVNVV